MTVNVVAPFETENVAFRDEFSPNRVFIAGTGSPVVFLHGPFGQEWPEFLNKLVGSSRKVIAPETPGADVTEDLTHLDHQWDLLLYYEELLANLGVESFDLIGHSFGGMIAAEFASLFPQKVRRLILIDPMGLWDDEHQVGDFVNGDPAVLQEQMWVTPLADQQLKPSTDEVLRKFLSIAAAAHFAAPIPEWGLIKRLQRIKSPTLIVWGAQDTFVPIAHAKMFADRIAGSKLAIIEGAAHYPHVEKEEEVSKLLEQFLS